MSAHPSSVKDPALAPSPIADDAAEVAAPRTRSRLFIKYVVLFMAVVDGALLTNGILELFFYCREHKVAILIQHGQAVAAAEMAKAGAASSTEFVITLPRAGAAPAGRS